MIAFTNQARAGFLPSFLDANDPLPAVQQIHRNYTGGWNEFEGFELVTANGGTFALKYPSDRPMREVARGWLRDELVVLFEYDWCAVIVNRKLQSVARID